MKNRLAGARKRLGSPSRSVSRVEMESSAPVVVDDERAREVERVAGDERDEGVCDLERVSEKRAELQGR